MAIPPLNPGRMAISGILRKSMILPHVLAFGLLFPALVLWGGSTNLINWGPGLMLAGTSCLLLLDKDRLRLLAGGGLHTGFFLLVLALMLIRALYSADVSAAANSSALIGFAAAGFLIGRLAGDVKSRAMLIGLSLVAMLNLACSVIQIKNPGWNLIYPQRSGGLPSGLFAHYSYSAAFCLGGAGLLISSGLKERAWLKAVLIVGAICALVTIPISLSRGGNLALAFMMAAAASLLLARAFSNSKSVMSMWLPSVIFLALILIFGSSVVPLIGRNKGLGGFYADSVRIDFWNAATEISAKHPWLGGGPGSFAWEAYHVMNGLTLEPGMVHNEALQLAVEYGYPALVFMAALILVPLALCLWRFANKTDAANTAWAALGLLAMLIQSNFESIFHAGPGAFIAALIIGKISRSSWGMGKANTLADDRTHPDLHFASTVKAHVDDYEAGNAEAVSKLVSLLLQSKNEQHLKYAYNLVYWKKTHNEEALRQAMNRLGAKFSERSGHLSLSNVPNAGKDISIHSRLGWRIFGNLTLAAWALLIALSGARLSQALIGAWTPLYHTQQLTSFKGFRQLLDLAEKNPGLGIDRQALSAAMACIYHYERQEDRENWATANRTRIQRAISGWKTDPGAALQIAEIIGWTGDVESALEFYNHAIASQGNNEPLFMAHSFKGQYLYELSLSAGAAGNIPQQQFFARQAIKCFGKASAALGKHHRKLDACFGKMLSECESFGKADM